VLPVTPQVNPIILLSQILSILMTSDIPDKYKAPPQ